MRWKYNIFLPQYLTDGTFIEEIRRFPNTSCSPYLSSNFIHENLFQADLIRELPFYVPERETIVKRPGVLLSNTCDMSLKNGRKFGRSDISFAAVSEVGSYRSFLTDKKMLPLQSVEDHIRDVTEQKITSAFYIPSYGERTGFIVHLDKISSVPSSEEFQKECLKNRIAVISDIYHYFFCFKLSVHLCRLNGDSRE
jgi:hypothetical protein